MVVYGKRCVAGNGGDSMGQAGPKPGQHGKVVQNTSLKLGCKFARGGEHPCKLTRMDNFAGDPSDLRWI